jgi:hypothetical protein
MNKLKLRPCTHDFLILLALENRPRLLALPPTHALLTRVLKLVHGLRLHLHTIPGLGWRNIVPLLNPRRVEEVLMQMIHVLQHTLLPRNHNVVDGAEVLCVLWQADAAGVRYNGHVVFCGHEQHGDDFVDAAETAGIDLADVDCARGQELLEHDAVLAHFAGCDADAVGLEGFSDGFVAEDWLGELAPSATVGEERKEGGDVPSSGEVGSSMNHGLNSCSCFIYSMASGTLHTWFASTMSTLPLS